MSHIFPLLNRRTRTKSCFPLPVSAILLLFAPGRTPGRGHFAADGRCNASLGSLFSSIRFAARLFRTKLCTAKRSDFNFEQYADERPKWPRRAIP